MTHRIDINTITKIVHWVKQIRNCPITIGKINKSEAMYVPHIYIIQVRSVRRRPDHHKTISRITVPSPISKHHHNVEIALDLLFVNGRPFLHTESRKIYFGSVQACNVRVNYDIISGLKKLNTKYQDRGFDITGYNGDNEFKPLQDFLSPAHLHTCAVNEYIGDIEKSI